MTGVEVKKIRRDLRMSQAQFAESFGFNLHTVQNWEQGLKSPSRPARVLLLVISHAPEKVREAIEIARAKRPDTSARAALSL